MATAASSPRTRQESKKAAVRKRPKRSRGLVGFAILIILGGLIWCAPIVVAKTSLRNNVVALLADVEGEVSVGSASFSWLSPVVLNDVTISDRSSRAAVQAPTVTSDKTLLALVMNQQQLGQFRLERPEINVELREKGSNVEDLAVRWLAPSDSTEPGATVAVEIVEANVNIHDAVTNKSWQLKPLNVSLAVDPTAALPCSLKCAGQVTSADGSGQFGVELVPSAQSPGADLKLDLERFPLAILQLAVRRVLPGAELAGLCSSNLQGHWVGTSGDARGALQGELTVDNFLLAGALPGGDRLQLSRIRVPCQVKTEEGRLKVDRLSVESDVGWIALEGSARLSELTNGRGLAALLREAYSVKGKIDVARVAHLIPNTLSIRQGTRITQGEIELNVASQPNGDRHTWQGSLNAGNIAADYQGQPLAWEHPVAIAFSAQEDAQGFSVQELKCSASFFLLDASGSSRALTAFARCDLSQLQRELERFVEFGEIQMAGIGTAELKWQREDDGRYRAEARTQVEQFQLVRPGKPVWQEPQVVAIASATGRASSATDTKQSSDSSIDTLSLQVQAGTERLQAGITRPIPKLTAETSLPVQVSYSGDLSGWAPRLLSLGVSGWELAGLGSLTATASVSSTGLTIEQSSLAVEQFQVWGNGWFINEPSVQLTAAGQYEIPATRAKLRELRLKTQALELDSKDFEISFPDAGLPIAKGKLNYRGDVAKLQQWTHDPRLPLEWTLNGRLTGDLELAGERGNQLRLDSTLNDVALVRTMPDPRTALGRQPAPIGVAGKTVWREPRLTLAARGDFAPSGEQWRLEAFDLKSDALRVRAAGKIDKPSTECLADIKGNIDYDLERIVPLLWPYVGEGVRLAGRDSRPFSIRGPLGSTSNATASLLAKLEAQAALGWTAGDVYGLRFGQGELETTLRDGRVSIKPLDMAVSDGRLRLAGYAQLTPEPSQAVVDRGQLIKEVRISPEMCATGLKFVAPILSEATRTEGKFSIDLEGAQIPLADPKQGDVGGRMTIHSVQVTPGPLAAEFVTLGQQLKAILQRRPPAANPGQDPVTLLTIENQAVDFRMVQGRVYHKGMEFSMGDVSVQTHGSVGLDESLSIVADIPMRPEWFGNDPIIQRLQGQTVSIPIGGTLRRPQLDRRAMEQLAGQLIQNTVRDTIQDELGKQLDKLFKPRQ